MLHFFPVTFQHSTEEVISKMTKIFLNPRLLAMQWFIKSNKNLPIGRFYHRIANKGVATKEELRQFERLSCKLATFKLHRRYFDRCVELNLVPDFLKFKPPNLEVYSNTDTYYQQVLKDQGELVGQDLKRIKDEYNSCVKYLRAHMSTFDFRLLVVLIYERSLRQLISQKKNQHNKKLYALWRKQRPETPECIINLSSAELTLSERNALVYGLNHHILPKNINATKIKSSIDSQINTICFKNKLDLLYDDKTAIREATDKFIHEADNICNSKRNRFLHNTLGRLSRRTDIKVCKMDKGVGVVIMNSDDYYTKLDSVVSDNSRFERLQYNINADTISECKIAPWILKENSVKDYCRKYLKEWIDEKTYRFIKPKGSQPGKLYGMAKNHKQNCPLRPVLSAINTAEYNLSKWLEKQIKPYLNNRFSTPSTSAFVEELSQLNPKSSDILVSFDIRSLYTNVPLDEVVNDIQRVIYSPSAPSSFFTKNGIKPLVFKNMLKVCSESIFLYNGKVYKQHDGVAMGSPLAPLLAEWFVAMVEEQVVQQSTSCKPIFYKRYVDDIFAVFHSITDRDRYFSILNNAHPNLTFTMEVNKSKLPFLDVSVYIKNGKYNTQVYRKPTNTGVLMNYHCEAPIKWKHSLIRCLLMRAYRNSSSFDLFEMEVNNIKSILRQNAYPDYFINSIISKFTLDHQIDENQFKQNKGTNTQKHQLVVTELDDVYLNIPYIGKPSEKLHRKIHHRMRNYNLCVKAAYSTVKVSSYFSLKSKCSDLFDSNVVYKFTCSRDENVSYIGETQRQLFRRISEHSDKTSDSPVFDHLFNCRDCQNTSNITTRFSIIQHSNKFNVRSLEAILINKLAPRLNIQLGKTRGAGSRLVLYN